jgi:putative heme-binding domain-containing protein
MVGDVQAEPPDPASNAKRQAVTLPVESKGEPLYFTTTLQTGTNDRPFALKVSYRMGEEPADKTFGPEQLLLPWAPLPPNTAIASTLVVPDLAGGDPARGRIIFMGDQARCSQCHLFRGQGGKVGPDLTEIGSKGRAEIYRSIATPSAAIEPAYVPYTVATKEGQVIAGVVRAEGFESIKVTDTNARATIIPKKQIDQIRPSATSIMPVGLTGTLGIDAIRDVIAYLTTPDHSQPRAPRASK